MRVLHIVKGLGPGGAERLLVSLAQVRTTDVSMAVAYVLPHKDQLVAELEDAGVPSHVLAGRRGLGDARWPMRLRRVVREVQPDVVHLHSPAVAAIARPVLRLLRGDTAIVSTEHNVWSSFGRVPRIANGLTLPLSHAKLAVSEEVRASVWSVLRGSVQVNLQGIPVAKLSARRAGRDAARAALGLAEDDVLVATVANFREKKDYPTLLAAAARCVDDRRLRFVSIGQGPLEADMHRQADRLGLGGSFRFFGYHPDPPAFVVAADVFALTSQHEGLPIALLEAMALGVTPVATAVGGIPEVITNDHDGVLLPPGDVEAFAATFRDLAADPHRRGDLADAAALRAQEFDIAQTETILEDLYRRLRAAG